MKLLVVFALLCLSNSVFAQKLSDEQLVAVFNRDNADQLDSLVSPKNVNECYSTYSLLSHAIRFGAEKCFDTLIKKGADVNRICEGYIPPLMHAAKYGRLEMVKKLIGKGAKVDYVYEGEIPELKGMTPLKYAEVNGQMEVVEYLKKLKAK